MSNSKSRPRVISSRAAPCLSCGVEVECKTNPRKYCGRCKLEAKRVGARVAMAAQRRKRGVPLIKGNVVQCMDCGTALECNRRVRKYCEICSVEAARERARIASKARRDSPDGREYTNAWQRNRRRIDPTWRVSAHMRVMIHRDIGARKQGRSWRSFVPYSLAELMVHLERQFTEGMSWERFGPEIHIDHIVPLASLKFDGPDHPDFKAAWALTNLRPMWALENIRKNRVRTHLL